MPFICLQFVSVVGLPPDRQERAKDIAPKRVPPAPHSKVSAMAKMRLLGVAA
jgi:hypothetical protein